MAEVLVICPDKLEVQALHDDEADGIRVGVFLITLLSDDLTSALLIAFSGTEDPRFARVESFENLGCHIAAYASAITKLMV